MKNKEWRATAAYLYILNLDPAGLAWEYLRRNPAYRREWEDAYRGRSMTAAEHWGLMFRRRSIA
jgi:hypothetical protein